MPLSIQAPSNENPTIGSIRAKVPTEKADDFSPAFYYTFTNFR